MKQYIKNARAFISRLPGIKATRWSALRKVGNSHVAHATVAIPIIGYLLIGSRAFINWFSPGPVDSGPEVGLLCTHAWRLVFLYYGLTCIGVATGLFGLFCDTAHKKYGDAIEFALGVKAAFSGDRAWTDLARTLKLHSERTIFLKHCAPRDLTGDLAIRIEDIRASAPSKNIDNDVLPTPDDALVLASLRTKFHFEDFERPVARALVFVLYVVGIAVVSCSGLWGLTEVTAALIGAHLPASPWCDRAGG